MKTRHKVLFYDIETTPLRAWIWGLGKQHVNVHQLDDEYSQYGIICIGYCWDDGSPVKYLDWGYEEQDTGKLVEEFDKILRQADHVIGKNSSAFDNKMLNGARFLQGKDPYPEWVRYTDDIETQMRKYFRLPSQSLDYISSQLGLGGKLKMEFRDWVNIIEKNKEGEKSFKKMIKYCKKDVSDSRILWNKLKNYIEPRFNVAAFYNKKMACKNCGSYFVHINKTGLIENYKGKVQGNIKYEEYYCTECRGYAGRKAFSKKEGKLL